MLAWAADFFIRFDAIMFPPSHGGQLLTTIEPAQVRLPMYSGHPGLEFPSLPEMYITVRRFSIRELLVYVKQYNHD